MFSKQNKFGQWSGFERVPGSLPLLGIPGLSGARLSATAGTSVTTSDVTGGTTISLTEHTSDRVMLMSEWGEWRTVRLPRTPAGVAEKTYSFLANSSWALTSATVYDIFAFIGADGFVDIERGTAWSSVTARAVALSRLDGAWVLATNPTRLHMGTIYASGTNTIDDREAARFVWNRYNRASRALNKNDSTTSWTYTTAGWRQARATSTNKVEVVVGDTDTGIDLFLPVVTTTPAGDDTAVGIGEDSTTADSSYSYGEYGPAGGTTTVAQAKLAKPVPLGYHYYSWLEWGAPGTATFYGLRTTDAPIRSGLNGSIWM